MPKASTDYFATHHPYHKKKLETTELIKELVINSTTFAFTCDGGGYTNRSGLIAKRKKLLRAFIYLCHLFQPPSLLMILILTGFLLFAHYLSVKLAIKVSLKLSYSTPIVKFLPDNITMLNKRLQWQITSKF